MHYTTALLRALHEKIPPEGPARHAMLLIDDVLTVTIIKGDKWYNYSMEESDADRNPVDVAQEIADDINKVIASGE